MDDQGLPQLREIDTSFETIEFGVQYLKKQLEPKCDFNYLQKLYERKEPLSAIVLCDGSGARVAMKAGIEIVVVGFSDGVPEGIPNEKSASLTDAVDAVDAVRSANNFSFLIGDIPYVSYKREEDLVKVSKLLMSAGANAVKVEGGCEVSALVEELTLLDIPVVGHIGYMPKTDMPMRLRGTTKEDFESLYKDAKALVEAGAKALVLELVHSEAAGYLTQKLNVPTVGVYSGGGTSGQALVLNDILDLTYFDPKSFPKGKPKAIGEWKGTPVERVSAFKRLVKSNEFPFCTRFVKPKLTLDQMWTSFGGSHYQ